MLRIFRTVSRWSTVRFSQGWDGPRTESSRRWESWAAETFRSCLSHRCRRTLEPRQDSSSTLTAGELMIAPSGWRERGSPSQRKWTTESDSKGWETMMMESGIMGFGSFEFLEGYLWSVHIEYVVWRIIGILPVVASLICIMIRIWRLPAVPWFVIPLWRYK